MAQFTNQASVTYNGVTVSSNIVTGEITQVISATKTATAANYGAGDIVTYVVSLQNSGTTPYTGLTVTDDLGAYTVGTSTVVPQTYTGDPVLYYINGRLQASPTVTTDQPLTISGITVPAGQSTELIYRVALNEFAPLGADAAITNTISVTGGGISEPITADATVTANTNPVLSIFKELSPLTVVENGQISYTFTIQNTGARATDAGDAIVLRDTFDPALSAPLDVTLNGAAWTQAGNYTYDESTGLFQTTPGAFTVPAATYVQDPTTGAWSITPGTTTITVTGTI